MSAYQNNTNHLYLETVYNLFKKRTNYTHNKRFIHNYLVRFLKLSPNNEQNILDKF